MAAFTFFSVFPRFDSFQSRMLGMFRTFMNWYGSPGNNQAIESANGSRCGPSELLDESDTTEAESQLERDSMER